MAAEPSLGAQIKDARERRRMTQQQLASVLGVDRKTVDNWENGRTQPRNRMGALREWAPELGADGAGPAFTDPDEAHIWNDWTDLTEAQRWELINGLRDKRRANQATGT